jgi:hypothetical protein
MGGGGIVSIAILIIVVWQIVSAIISHAQEQKRRQAEAEARRARAGGGSGPTSTKLSPGQLQQGSSTAGGPVVGTPQSKLDELAARRQQQLEELRRRRESGRQTAPSGGSTASAPARRTSQWEAESQLRTGQQQGGPGRPSRTTQAIPSGSSRRMSPGEKQRLIHEQQRAARQQQEETRLREVQKLERRRREEAEVPGAYAAGEIGVEAARRSERDAYLLAVVAAPDQPITSEHIQQNLHHRAALRQLIVMKEILDPPVSMREPRYG